LSIGGVPMPLDRAAIRPGIGYVPDVPILDPRLTPEEWLAFVRGIKQVGLTAEPIQVADELELSVEDRQRPIRTLSHGTQRKVALWAEVLTASRALILDEPFQGLDPSAIAGAERALRAYAREFRAVLVSTHLLHEASTLATHVGILLRGKTVVEGSVEVVAAHHGSLRDAFLAHTAG
jgi:ABC-2 type transport system ATP-binding protein